MKRRKCDDAPHFGMIGVEQHMMSVVVTMLKVQ
eukprot:CAMPEP_0178602148 /NCGR_PEP_ID=MMETSP0697-20121206/34807_1 /TAXON_ID=265572 /ORGANISM="Extubocellulus spinifer, Strain CCMP396" /LENGTH=32 /DNA_ID= /DNA_START= /DNA_END= /DNA_ORIENTATION=